MTIKPFFSIIKNLDSFIGIIPIKIKTIEPWKKAKKAKKVYRTEEVKDFPCSGRLHAKSIKKLVKIYRHSMPVEF